MTLSLGLLGAISYLLISSSVQDSLRPSPAASTPSTTFLNHSSYLAGFADQQWYLDNIPFIDVPDVSIQDVYYYRTSVVKRHLKYFHQGHGWSFTEFIQPVAWASKAQTIPDSAAHHILEARWLRDSSYVQDLIQLYTRAGVEKISGITYTHFIHQAIFEYAQAIGDSSFLESQLQGMIQMYNLWNVTQDQSTGLYHRTPLLDAQEFSLPGYLVGGPGMGMVQQWNSMENDYDLIDNGPETYRISFNAYMVAAARSISDVAGMTGQSRLAQEWNITATALLNNMQSLLYDNDLNFWIDVIQGTNQPAVGRQLIGYYPYRFGIGTNSTNIQGLETGLNNKHFLTQFGPTTLEQINPYYTAFKNITYCCLWNGQSWPFSTSVYLHVLADLARNGLSKVATPAFLRTAFETYAKTNYKDGRPYTAEVHYPTINAWSGDTTNHSEHYFHSTYMDNVFTDLLGLIPSFDNTLRMQPLISPNWTYWAVENLPYHGLLLSMIFDADGAHYPNLGHSKGFSIFIGNSAIFTSPNLPSHISVALPTNTASTNNITTYVNILTNPNAPYSLPSASASYAFTPNGDSATSFQAYKTIDNLLWYDLTPDNYWTANQSATPFTSLNYTLPRPRTFSSISLAILGDTSPAVTNATATANPARPGVSTGHLLACPDSVKILNNRTGAVLATRSPWTSCVPNALNTIDFDVGDVTTDEISLLFVAKQYLTFAISEAQIWVPKEEGVRWEAEDSLMGTFIGGFEGRFAGGNTSLARGSYNSTGGNFSSSSSASLTDGGVILGPGSWIEWGGVTVPSSSSGTVVVEGAGNGSIILGLNFLTNTTLTFTGSAGIPVNLNATGLVAATLEKTVLSSDGLSARENATASGVSYLTGGNVITIWAGDGLVFVDAIYVL